MSSDHSKIEVSNPDFEKMVRESFAQQGAMSLIQASLGAVTPGEAEIRIPHSERVEQQDGFVHGGVVGMLADSAAGYAAMTLIPAGDRVLSVEYKLNFVAPAQGDEVVARGRVLRAGRTLIVSAADVFSVVDGRETLCAIMQQTIIVMRPKP